MKFPLKTDIYKWQSVITSGTEFFLPKISLPGFS